MRFALPCLIVIAVLTGQAQAQPQPAAASRVLVMPFSAVVDPAAPGGAGAAHWLGEAASVLLGEGLSTFGLGALARDERVAAFDRLQLPASPALTRATVLRVGELVGATEVVFGDVHLGANLIVSAHIVHVESGRELPRVSDQAPLSEIFGLFDRLARQVAAATGRDAARGPATAAFPPLPLEIFENYIKGLVAAAPTAQQRFLEDALAGAPRDARILTALWGVYSAQGLHDKALAAANVVPASSPMARKARFAVALSLIDLKRFDGAFKELSTLQAARPAGVLLNALGVVQLRRGASDGSPAAATYFARALEESPGNTDYLFNLGYAHALAQNSTAALNGLREAVRHDAANGDAHLVMSVVLAASGRMAEAQRELELARLLGTKLEGTTLAISTKVPVGLERLEADLDLVSAPRSGGPVMPAAQSDQRETAAFHLARGRELADSRRDREAQSELKRAIYLAPYEDEPHVLLGRLYQRAGRLTEAMDEFKVALWCRETSVARLALALALFESGDRAGARREAERALVLAPGSTDARDLLKRIGG